MAQPSTFEDALRVHDVAFYKWLGGLTVDYGNLGGSAKVHFPILRVRAAPERAVAGVVDLLVSQGFISPDAGPDLHQSAQKDFGVLPLPLATFERDEPTDDPELPNTPKQIPTMEYDGATGLYTSHPAPAHYRTEYRVTFWMLKGYTEAYINEWIRGQLGKIGCGRQECLIDVEHDAPWGTMQQSLKLMGASDQSDLEGEGLRYLRKEYTFSLRTWIMRPATIGAPPVEHPGIDAGVKQGDDEAILDEANQGVESFNLFRVGITPRKIPTLWPKEGAAVVDSSEDFPADVGGSQVPFTFRMEMSQQADKVLLVERPTILDSQGFDLFGLSFQYKATAQVELEILQRNVATDLLRPADSLVLPQTFLWKKVHRFTVVSDDSYLARIAGIAGEVSPQVVKVSNIDLRRIYTQEKVSHVDTEDLGDQIRYRWFSLARKPWLCIIVVSATIGGLNVVTVEDDAAAPTYTAAQAVDSSVHVGLAFLVQPKTSSLGLRVPKDTTVASVWAQRFDGAYNGNTV